MKYINVILVIIALLSNQLIFNAENTILINNNEKSNEQKEKTLELNSMQEWNNHLELLTIKGEYWNATDNVPNDKWQYDTFDIAEKIIKEDKNSVEMLKTSFFDAIKTKIALEKGEFTKETTTLISDFDKRIESILLPKESEQVPKEIIVTPLTPEIIMTSVVAPELNKEVAPVETETSSPTTEVPTMVAQKTDSLQPKNLKSEWKEVLESVKQDESIAASLNKAYDLTRELLLAGQTNPAELEKEFNDALTIRMLQKKLDPTVVNNERSHFKMNIVQQLQPSIDQSVPHSTILPMHTPISTEQERVIQQRQKEALEKLQEEYAQKDMKLKEEWQKQNQKEEQERLKILAAAAKAEQEGALAKEKLQQIHYSVQAKKERDHLIEEKLKEELAQIAKAREELSKNIQYMAEEQKDTAEKGLLSTFTDAISNWWYGPHAKKPTELTTKEQEKFLTALVQNTKNPEHAKQTFKEFQQILLNFHAIQWWNPEKGMPNSNWIHRMQILMKEIVIEHKIMAMEELANIIESVIRTKVRNYPKIIATIKKLTQEEQVKQKQHILEAQARLERKREKKEQIILAQQKRKEAEENKIAEEKKQKSNIIQYKKEKDEWYDLLYQVASNKKATNEDNSAHTQQALQKSQSLLQLATNIPTKNKSALSQKLKQKFSVALLEQQKNNYNDLNIYHNMDVFNGGVNKIIE